MKMRTLHGASLAALVLAVSLLAAACGGSATTENTTDTAADTAGVITTAASDETPTNTAGSGSILFSGLVDYEMTFTSLDMDYMDWVTADAEDPNTGLATYDGVLLSDVFAYVEVKPNAKTVVVTGREGASTVLTLADISSDALLAVTGGGALSLVMPGMGGEAWVDDVVRMELK